MKGSVSVRRSSLITRPMLAAKVKGKEIERLSFPLIATPKLDGIRCLMINGKAVSRKFLPIPNEHTRRLLEESGLPDNLDGELMLGRGDAAFQDVTSAFMRRAGEPLFQYCVFDLVTREGGLEEPYQDRLATLNLWGQRRAPPFVKVVESTVIDSTEELERYEETAVKFGYEGICLRRPDSPYKLGRSTVGQQYLVALKRFVDDDTVLVIRPPSSGGRPEAQPRMEPTGKLRAS